jgi:transcriptional regulator with XRE-family HTH domain
MKKALSEEQLANKRLEVAEAVARQRKVLGITQQQLADQVGCSRLTIRRVELGSGPYSMDLALQMCRVLGLTIPLHGKLPRTKAAGNKPRTARP